MRKKRRPRSSRRSPSQRGRLAEALVLGEAGRKLGCGLLGALLLDLGVALAEQPARLDLAERRDEQQELGDGLEVELLGLGEALDVLEHDRRDRHLDELDLLAQDQCEQQVERPRVRVEVELELEDGRAAHLLIVASRSDAHGRLLGIFRPAL